MAIVSTTIAPKGKRLMTKYGPTERKPVAEWELPVTAWAEWPSHGETELPKLEFVEPILRRRLSPLSKASLWVAHKCAHDLTDVRMVYASRHGEIDRTTDMLNALSIDEPLSPTAFSTSVLNATVGLYSIIRGNSAPATAIAAGPETLGYGLLEAYGQLKLDPVRPVLLIYADESIPEVWQSCTNQSPYALALLLNYRSESMRIRCWRTPSENLVNNNNSQVQSFIECVKGQESIWANEGAEWHWKKQS